MREVKAQAFAFKQVINEVAPNANANTIANVYIKAKSGNKDFMEAYGDLVNKIDNGLKEKALEVYNNSPEAIRHEIFKDSGINVDDAIRKSIDRRTEEEKKAVESYFRLLKEKIEENDPHADETVSNNPRLESDEVRSRVNENESYARNAKEERQDVKMDFDVKRERAIALEPELESLERDGSLEYYDEIKPDATPEQKQAVKDYAEAKARYDAMLEPLKQRFEEQKEKAESYVDGITNPEDGNVTHVKLKGWKGDYFVISGKIDVLRGENDEIITWNSTSDSLVVTDKDGEKRMISLKDIEDVISQQPAEQIKSDLIQKIEQDENALYGEIDGNLSFDNGSKFSIINPEGNVQKVEIRVGEQGQREAVIDEGDGHMSVVPLDENVANKLREMEFSYRKYRYDSKTAESDSKPNNVQNGAIEDDSDIFFGQSEKGNTGRVVRIYRYWLMMLCANSMKYLVKKRRNECMRQTSIQKIC